MKKHAIIPIFISHRGCPNQCVFCNQRAITTRDGDVSPDDVRRTAESYLSTLEKKDIELELSFFGGSFTGIPIEDQSAFLAIAKEYKDAGRIHRIHCSTRPDYISKEILDNLKEYGMDTIELGVQSFDQKVLDECKRGHKVEDVYRACELIHSYGFTLGIQLMIGLPGDSFDSCIYSANKAVEMKPSIARLYPTVVLDKTPLAEMLESGAYISPSQDEMVLRTKEMYKILTNAGVNVIRIGLKSNELIKGETYHPAIGQIVKSSIALDEIERVLSSINLDGIRHIVISAPAEKLNFAVGHEASNKKSLQSKYPNIHFNFREDNSLEGISVSFSK